MLYFASVIALLLVLPLVSTGAEMLAGGPAAPFALVAKWFTFWGVGVRLFIAGVMQVTRPQFTSKSIFGIADPAAASIVREVGFGNLAMGTLGLASLLVPQWLVPAAVAGGIYYGLAGVGHAIRPERNAKEQFALVSDFGICAILAVSLLATAL